MQPTAALGAELEVAFRTDPGCDPTKQVNEDACGEAALPLGHLLVVCDGMGGHTRGSEASRLAVATLSGVLARAPAASPPGPALLAAIGEAGRAVWGLGGADAPRPGSTCVAVLVHAAGAEIAHVGDSRAHLVRAGQAWAVTRDHSIVQQLVDAGLVRAEDVDESIDAGAPGRVSLTPPQARELLTAFAGNISRAARQVGVPRSTFRGWLAVSR
jgi:protein phosphatase